MTMTVEEGEEIVKITRATGQICAVNYGYTGYALVRHMKAMVARGDLGVEIGDAALVGVQKKIIEFTRGLNKPVITATQMI